MCKASHRPPAESIAPKPIAYNETIDRLATYPTERLYARRRELIAAGQTVYDFSVGDPREPTADVIRQAFHNAVPEVSQYPSALGQPELREACAAWYRRRFGIDLDPAEEILPSSGSKEAIFHLPLTFINAAGSRKRVLFGTPAYPIYQRGALFAGGQPWSVALQPDEGYLLRPWQLPEPEIAETAIIWINYPHNPTAATATHHYLEKLVRFCHERNILLCSDECYVDLYFGTKPPSILEITKEGVLAFHSLSKRSGMTGYRSGFVAGDAKLIALLRKTRPNFGTASSEMVQRAAIAAWSSDDHANERRKLFLAKRDAMLAGLEKLDLRARPCDATFYLWTETPGGTDPVAYAEWLTRKGILVSPAPFLGSEEAAFRIALVPSLDDCRRALQIWPKGTP